MKKRLLSAEAMPFNRAAFRLDSREVRAGNLEALVDAALSQVLGGDDVIPEMSCVQYTCNVYAVIPER